MGFDINFNAENTSIVTSDTLVVGGNTNPVIGLSGTHFSVSAVPDNSGGDSLIIFMQTKGDDITMFTRDLSAGAWTMTLLPIPDT
jgi:hypothetical protein